MNTDTIAAVATPPGRGGIGIIRLSGSNLKSLVEQLLGQVPPARAASHRLFRAQDGSILDDGLALFFPAPHSFTGEDVLELQGHGGVVVLDMLLKRCVELGARLARPGEFSERAFLNNKLDLTQAEAIADLIDSSSEQAARSALRSLQGDFSKAVDNLLTALIELRVYVEAALDFPDEEIDFLADSAITQRLTNIKQQLAEIFQKAQQGSLLRDGMHLVIVGRPNAGKSSLLNALAGQETAIVTDIAGTTRDVLRERINLEGMPLHIVDTAGLRESYDPVEKIGIERAWREVEKADLVLMLVDDTQSESAEHHAILDKLPATIPVLTVHNKVDLTGKAVGKQGQHLYISAKQGLGLDVLKTELKTRMGYQGEREDTFMARRRHLQALEITQAAVGRAEQQLLVFNAGELMAEELRLAQDALGQITGKFTSDDLLGEIFSSFCIGK
ncbi:tRNA uridine-5-carboxymethylaminomethyl(34) synthesis GTPase MnmE [uncultured Thiothrix sp.]|uniref:tRNA uridine-5-carboxymethylaminomethyl(34) synthesis GTPase MnmE n=1 Tax=uncultured Thiothrix sp. TaxID=223185 RepID=UPI0026110E41|nr:tRNA uridine-5-carboxymethylaminomethyl(34) synthesis GTPase MnmE [uncultured Thiothrix sp.]